MVSSFLNKAPALLILESTLMTIFCTQRGLSLRAGIVSSELLIFFQMLIYEERWSWRRGFIAAATLFLCLLLSVCTAVRIRQREPLPQYVADDFTVIQRRSWGERALLILEDSKGRKWIAIARDSLDKAYEGGRFFFRADVRILKNESRRSSFSPLRYWNSRGVKGELRNITDVRALPKRFSIHRLRSLLREQMRRLPSTSRAIISAILLGDRETNISEDFRRWGISHFLAVSGWHVGFAVALAALVAGKRRWGLYAASLLLWLYCLISGMTASALRAAIMLQTVLIGLMFGTGSCGLNSVGVAGTLMLIINPSICYDIGWQLSILAATVAVGLQKIQNVWMFLLTSPFMWMTASPFISELSGGIYLSSLPVNIMATVFFSFVLGSVLLCGLPVLLGLQFYFLPYCAEKVFHVWAVAADQWTKWLPQALPAGFFPLWFCGGAVTLLTASALKISRWRAVVSAGGVGFVLYCLCEGSL